MGGGPVPPQAAGGVSPEPTNVVRPDGEQGSPTPGLGTMGMAVFLASLSMLFLASIIGYLVVWFTADEWPPAWAPKLPWSLWLSTALALGCSVTMQIALLAIKAGNNAKLLRFLWVTNGLAFGFLVVQAVSWLQFYDRRLFDPSSAHLYGFTFYMLTIVHALHVLGGVIALGVVTYRARKGAYNWAFFPGVRHCTLYWHFLDAVWIVLYGLLLLTS